MSGFFAHSRSIVEDFLQTAVFLDDEPTYRYEERIAQSLTAIPPEGRGVTNTVSGSENSADEAKEHFLDATSITNTFMEKGIICSILNCEEDTYSEKEKQYFNLMKNADITVLDWSLFKDNGERVIDLIKKLIVEDEQLHELRSLVIYTASDIEYVKKQLSEIGLGFEGNSNISYNQKYTFVSIYAKPISSNADDSLKVEFIDLVDRCIDDFTKCFSGIIPNVAMASVSELRNNTHKLLGVLNKDLDIAYLSHRALLPIPEEAEKHIEELVINELESILHCNEVGKNAKYNIIKHHPDINNKQYQGKDFNLFLKNGAQSILNKTHYDKIDKVVQKGFTKEWYGNENLSSSSENNFAKLSLLQTKYSIKKPYLTLGIIIEERRSSKKFLCLQPRCDSTRLVNSTEFIFLELQKANEKKFDIILNNDEKYLLNYAQKYRCSISFKPNSGLILATKRLYFNSTDNRKFKYIATLKKMQAQKVANEYGAYITRVGLNESEYLRRSRSKSE